MTGLSKVVKPLDFTKSRISGQFTLHVIVINKHYNKKANLREKLARKKILTNFSLFSEGLATKIICS